MRQLRQFQFVIKKKIMTGSFNIRPKLVILTLNINHTTALILIFGMWEVCPPTPPRWGSAPEPRVCGVGVHRMHLTLTFTLKKPKEKVKFEVTPMKA